MGEKRINKPHIMICGGKDSGKSALIYRLTSKCTVPIGGFATRCSPKDVDGLHCVYIHHPADETMAGGRENLVGICNGSERTIYPQIFDTLGVKYLRQGGSIIIMDELGFMEANSRLFCQEVFSRLDGDTHVLAAIKATSGVAFLDKARNHPKTDLYNITKDNQEDLFHLLLPIVLSWNNEELAKI